jgi:hypothetical protein
MVVVFIVTLIGFLLTRMGSVYLINKKNSFYTDGDAIGHLNYVQEIYSAEGRIPAKLRKYILDYNDYPNGFHKLFYLLKIPLSALERWGGYVPVLCDLGLLCFTALCMHHFGGTDVFWLLTFPFLRLFIANEGRSSHFSERAYGVFWGNVFLGAMIGYHVSGELFWIPLALAGFFIFSVSSKFAWQGTFFITLLLCVLEQSLFFVGFYLSAFTLSVLLSRGYSYRVLKGLLRHSIFYKTYLSKRYFGLPKHYRVFLGLFKRGGLRDRVVLSMNSSVCKVISDNPLNLAVLFLLCVQDTGDVFMSASLAGIALVLLISLEPLKFLGEPERYLEFSALPVFVLLSQKAIPLPIVLAVFVATGGFYALHCYFFSRAYAKQQHSSRDLKDLLAFFEGGDGGTVLTLPMRLSFFLGYCTASYKFVTLFSNIAPGEEGAAYKALIPDYYPYPGQDLMGYVAHYTIDYIVQDKDRTQLLDAHVKASYYSFMPFKLVYENESYAVYAACQ